MSRGVLFDAISRADRGSTPKISTSLTISLASLRIVGIKSTLVKRLKLLYGAMPPDDITLMYAAAKGISLSKPEDLSLALFIGTTKKPSITKRGNGTKIKMGKKLNVNAATPATIETGTVRKVIKNISDMYVS